MANHWEQLQYGQKLFDSNGDVVGFEEEMYWDEMQETFVLTTQAVKNEIEVDLEMIKKSKKNADVFLKEVALIIHEYIYKKKQAVLREKTKYFIKYDSRVRKALYITMIDMLRYAFIGGGNKVGYQPALNFNETTIGDIEKVRDERMLSYVSDSRLKTLTLVDRNFVELFSIPNEEW